MKYEKAKVEVVKFDFAEFLMVSMEGGGECDNVTKLSTDDMTSYSHSEQCPNFIPVAGTNYYSCSQWKRETAENYHNCQIVTGSFGGNCLIVDP